MRKHTALLISKVYSFAYYEQFSNNLCNLLKQALPEKAMDSLQ